MKFKKLIQDTGLRVRREWDDFEVAGVSCDSRRCRSGSVFAAIKGESKDGRNHLRDALKRGAAAVICKRKINEAGAWVRASDVRGVYGRMCHEFFGCPSRRMRLTGVTGTNGKTTCTHLLSQMLSSAKPAGLLGTVGHRFGSRAWKTSHTTPDAEDLNCVLSEMAGRGCRAAVMEVSSHALDQSRTAGLEFEAVLYTNFTQDHLDYHGSMRAYFGAKKKLLKQLKKGGTTVLNRDDALVSRLADGQKHVLSYGLKSACGVKGKIASASLRGTEFWVSYKRKRVLFRTPMIGIHNVYNILGATAAAVTQGVSLQRCEKVVKHFTGVSGRMERIAGKHPINC